MSIYNFKHLKGKKTLKHILFEKGLGNFNSGCALILSSGLPSKIREK